MIYGNVSQELEFLIWTLDEMARVTINSGPVWHAERQISCYSCLPLLALVSYVNIVLSEHLIRTWRATLEPNNVMQLTRVSPDSEQWVRVKRPRFFEPTSWYYARSFRCCERSKIWRPSIDDTCPSINQNVLYFSQSIALFDLFRCWKQIIYHETK